MANKTVKLETGPIIVPRSLLNEIVERGYKKQHQNELMAILATSKASVKN